MVRIEISDRQARAEPVAFLGGARTHGALCPELAPGGRESGPAAVEDRGLAVHEWPHRIVAARPAGGRTDREVLEAVAIEVARCQGVPEPVWRVGQVGRTGRCACQDGGARQDQPVGAAPDDRHHPGRHPHPETFARDADREVRVPVAVEVARCEGLSEPIAGLWIVGKRVLRPQLIAGRGQTGSGSVQHVDRAREARGADTVGGDPDRQVRTAVPVEVCRCQRAAERIARDGDRSAFAGAQHARGVLGPGLVARGTETAGRSVQDVDHAGVPRAGQVLPGHADGEIGATVTIEVGWGRGRDGRPRQEGRWCRRRHGERRDGDEEHPGSAMHASKSSVRDRPRWARGQSAPRDAPIRASVARESDC